MAEPTSVSTDAMIHALALILASATAAEPTTLSVKVVSIHFSYPYFGEPGNTCQRGSIFVRATTGAQEVVVRMVETAGLTPGSEAVLEDVRRAGTGRDGTAVFCGTRRLNSAPAPALPVASAVEPSTQPPLVAAEPVTAPTVDSSPKSAPAQAEPRCVARLFNIIKKPLGDKKFGPSEFDPESALDTAEPVDCSLARSKVTNVLLLRMVKDGASKPAAVVGAEWGSSTWQRDPDAPQRRLVKVYLVELPEEATSQR